MNLAPPKIVVQNKVNISYIHCSESWSSSGLSDIAADCSAPCGPIQSKFHVVNRLGYGKRWLEFRWCALTYTGAAVEKLSKTVKNGKNRQFLTVFQPLRRRKSTHINEIPIICCPTLASSPRKILARSVHRGPSNQPRPQSTRLKMVKMVSFCEICEILTSFSAMIFGGAKFIKHQVLYIKKNLRHSAISTSKDIKIGQLGPEKRGVSK